MTWRCPICGCTEVKVEAVQSYSVSYHYMGDDEMYSETGDPVSDQDITWVECQGCGETDADDKDWHMSDLAWRKEIKARAADVLYDLAMDK